VLSVIFLTVVMGILGR